jgi:hypothetical protein
MGLKKKVKIFFKLFKMKLMQVWFANPMWVDEVLSAQNWTSVLMGAGSLKPSTWFYCKVG